MIEPHPVAKLVFVCEDSNPMCLEHLTILSEQIFKDMQTSDLSDFLKFQEQKMLSEISKSLNSLLPFSTIDLGETKQILIANHNLDQYT